MLQTLICIKHIAEETLLIALAEDQNKTKANLDNYV